MSNQKYDAFKKFVTVLFPALITFYLVVAGSWHLPYTEPIVGTATGLATFLGLALKALSTRYSVFAEEQAKIEEASKPEADGYIHFVKFGDEDANLILNVTSQEQVESFADRDELTFKVRVG